jgi:catechol 2,3-dioxygenase-like lactoylglutathione lyase family enzyme
LQSGPPLCRSIGTLRAWSRSHPILGTRDLQRAIEFYTQQLGFELAFGDDADPPNYVGFRRDAVEFGNITIAVP